jgi:predicted dehydrogenase
LIAPLRTLLVGLGSIGAAYAEDNAMARTVPYVTHAQVLGSHPGYRWDAAVDISESACERVRKRWGVERVGQSVEEIGRLDEIEVVVLATPPSFRNSILAALPNLKAVLVEKPLGTSLEESADFLRACDERGLVTQVNLTRRADTVMRELAHGGLANRIGQVQCAFGVYGNGIINYATHTVDLVRMLLGEVVAVQALSRAGGFEQGPLAGDINIPFTLFLANRTPITLHPVRFSSFREGSLDLWGDKGRLEILQEGLLMRETPLAKCRSLEGAFELAAEGARLEPTGYGHALYDLYDDLAAVLDDPSRSTCSSCASALITEQVIHSVVLSNHRGGAVIELSGT